MRPMAFVLGYSKCHGLSGWPHRVLFSTWALPAQPYSRHEKRRCRSRAHRSTITRLPSGASVSRSTSFRSGAFGVGAGTAHRCTGALAALRRIPAPRGPLRPLRGSLRSGNLIASRQAHPTVSFGVSLRIRSHLCGLWLRAEYRPSPYPRTSAASAQSRLAQRLKCTCAAGIRLANERSEELCEAKSQEPAPHG